MASSHPNRRMAAGEAATRQWENKPRDVVITT